MLPVLLSLVIWLQPPAPGPGPAPASANGPKELEELSQALQKLLVANTPREIEDRTDWGKTVPLEKNLALMQLRTKVKVDGRDELPDGMWSRSKLTVADAEKDVRIRIRDLKTLEGGKQLIHLELDVRCGWEHERKLWTKGISVAGINASGTTSAQIQVQAEYSTMLDVAQFPPKLKVEAKVKETRVDLREFTIKRLNNSEKVANQANKLADELKPLLQLILSRKEPEISQAVNQALEKVLKK